MSCWVQITPDIKAAGIIEETSKRHRALPRHIRYYRASAVDRPVENSVRVAHKNRGDRWIDLTRSIIQKGVPVRIAIRRINTSNAKDNITK